MVLYEPDIRKILYSKLISLQEFNSDPSTIIINELDVCQGAAIMDVAVINGKLHGFEIKSERDNLERLNHQKDIYNLVFDTVTLVVSEKYTSPALDIIPEWWGIYEISSTTREAEMLRNPHQNNSINAFHICQMLWKAEAIDLLSNYGITKGLKSKTRRELCSIIADNLNFNDIKEYVLTALKNRINWKAVSLQQLNGEKHL